MTPTRRDVIIKGVAGVAAAWVAPSILSTSAAAAATAPFAVLEVLEGGFSRYVAMSASGTYLRSLDAGDTWTAPTTPPPFTATHIAGDTNGFVAADSTGFWSRTRVESVRRLVCRPGFASYRRACRPRDGLLKAGVVRGGSIVGQRPQRDVTVAEQRHWRRSDADSSNI